VNAVGVQNHALGTGGTITSRPDRRVLMADRKVTFQTATIPIVDTTAERRSSQREPQDRDRDEGDLQRLRRHAIGGARRRLLRAR
jgi:hypothetical protein